MKKHSDFTVTLKTRVFGKKRVCYEVDGLEWFFRRYGEWKASATVDGELRGTARGGCILADEMGLGKTAQAIA